MGETLLLYEIFSIPIVLARCSSNATNARKAASSTAIGAPWKATACRNPATGGGHVRGSAAVALAIPGREFRLTDVFGNVINDILA